MRFAPIRKDNWMDDNMGKLYEGWTEWIEATVNALEMNEERTEQEEKILNTLKAMKEDGLMNIPYRKLEKLMIPNTKATNKAFDNHTDLSDETEIVVSSRKAKQEVVITTKVVSQLDATGIRLTRQLSEQDRCVFDAVCTLFESGQTVFSAKQVYQTYTGADKPNEKALENVENSLNKMRTTLIDIDWTAHAQMKGLDDETAPQNVTVTRNGYLLPLESMTFKSGGKVVTGYQIIKEPAYLTYSRLTGQLITIPAEMLKLESINRTPERVAIHHYILRHVENMNNSKNKYGNHTMLFETIFEKCGIIEITNRQTKLRYVDAIEMMLDELIQKKYIKGYNPVKKGRAKTGVEIIL